MERKNLMNGDDLRDAGVVLVENDNEVGGWEVYQFRTNGTKRWRTRRPIIDLCTRHPNGRDKYYPGVCIMYDGRYKNMTLHQLVWIYHNDNYPQGYDICHKDDDPYNCQLDNLEVKPHIENIKEREANGANQFKNSVKK